MQLKIINSFERYLSRIVVIFMIKDITFITVNYAPEDTAIGLYTSQLAEFLATQGFNVSVVAAFPYYPQWKIRAEYQDKPKYYSDVINGVTIYRYKLYVPTNQSFFKRILHIMSYTFGTYFNLSKIKNANLVFCNIPFTTCVALGLILKRRKKAKLWTSVKDFEFDAAFETGLIKENFVTNVFKKLLKKIEAYLYNNSDVVSSISYNMMTRIKNKAPLTNPEFFPDWVDVDFINPNNYKHHNFISKEKFTVLYSGNIGQKQDWEIYVSLAQKLSVYSDIEFVLVGEGAYKTELLEILEKENLLDFIKYYEPIPYEDLSDLLCSADLHVLFQKSDVTDSVMPSKILGMMSSSTPSIITGDLSSEVAKHFKLSQDWGFYSNNEENLILENILKLKENKKLQEELGKKARNYMVENFSKDIILNSFLNKINNL